MDMKTDYRPAREPLVAGGEIDCHTADMTATISAEMPLETAQARLAMSNQWIPIDGEPRLTIGQLVEENSSGPLRLGYGAWRDLLLGCQFKTHTGKLITAGGRTMKNVAGYDLTKLMVGQRGILGSLVTITTRTYKRPTAALVAEFSPSDRWLGTIIATPLRPRYAILSRESLTCGWLDDDAALSLFEQLAAAQDPKRIFRYSLADDITRRAGLWRVWPDSFRAAVPATKILSFVENTNLQNWIADAALGIVIGPCHGEEAIVEKAARVAGGSATFFVEGRPPRWEQSAAETQILGALKRAFA
jgi:hypothetical protein